jgi:outer membrane protein assembly factor BamB
MSGARALIVLAAAAALAACAASSAGVSAPQKPQHVSWAMYQHSPHRNAVFQGYSIPHDWSYEAKAKINSGLALVGNTLLFTSFAHRLVALDVRYGRELWHAELRNIAMSTPIVAGNTVYVGTGNNDRLDRTLIQKIRFYKKDVFGVPGGDEVAAFDLRTGKRRWTFRTVGQNMPSAVYVNERLIFANGDWHAYALRADNGKPLWSTELDGASMMAHAVQAGNAVVFGICAHSIKKSWAVAVHPATGKVLWKSPYGYCDAAPAYADGKIFVASVIPGDMHLLASTSVAALDAKTGKPLWVYRGSRTGVKAAVGSNEGAIAGTYVNGIYYQSAPFTNELFAFDAKTGKIRWRFQTAGPIKMSPVVANGRLYVGDTVGVLYEFDARSGKVLELHDFKQPFTTSPPIVAGNKLLIANGTTVNAIPLSGNPDIPVTDPG